MVFIAQGSAREVKQGQSQVKDFKRPVNAKLVNLNAERLPKISGYIS